MITCENIKVICIVPGELRRTLSRYITNTLHSGDLLSLSLYLYLISCRPQFKAGMDILSLPSTEATGLAGLSSAARGGISGNEKSRRRPHSDSYRDTIVFYPYYMLNMNKKHNMRDG